MGLRLEVDFSKCSGCKYCELWCSFKHEGFFSSTFSRIKIIKDDLREIDFPLICQNCEDAPCSKSCPTKALYFDEKEKKVKLDEFLCIGCGSCIDACPYGYLSMNPLKLKPLLCDLCGGQPECVKRCPTGALFLTSRDQQIEKPQKHELGKDYATALAAGLRLRSKWGIRDV
ncbi:MAG: 4Fe-4S dicluster domain-containing protein [Fervidicoccaceae archaeon]